MPKDIHELINAVLAAWFYSIIIQQAFDDQLFLEPLLISGKLCRIDELVIAEDGLSVRAMGTILQPPESITLTIEIPPLIDGNGEITIIRKVGG